MSSVSATTIDRSFKRSLSAIMPPVKPTRMENGPLMSIDGKRWRKSSIRRFSSSGMCSIVDQNGAASTRKQKPNGKQNGSGSRRKNVPQKRQRLQKSSR